MRLTLGVLALATAAVAAVRSTWSPCGRSMLSTITPLAERGRDNAYRSTCAWFIAGSLTGGACLGAVLGAVAAAAAFLPSSVAAGTAAVGAAVALASDARLGGFALPVHHRQVNEVWLDRYRPWVYGAGFGWQIGTGFATYIVSAGLYLMACVAVVSGLPFVGFGAGLAFGAVRGLAVLAGRRITDTEALVAFHRRFDAVEPAVARALLSWEAMIVLVGCAWTALRFGAAGGASVGGLCASVLAACVALGAGLRRRRGPRAPVAAVRDVHVGWR